MSRGRIVLAGLAILLALDAGRSYYARVGFARPSEVWRPDPAVFADLAWPPGVDLPPDQPLGRRVYAQRCAVCHGPDGRGNGPAAPSLIPRPRDFTLGLFKYKSTVRNDPPTDDDLVRVVKTGLTASAMPAFGDLLTDEEVRAVADEIKRFARIPGRAGASVVVAGSIPADATSIDRGRALYARLECGGCHGVDGRKTGFCRTRKIPRCRSVT